MLSRVAESLYWTGRYIERAEDTSRLLHVNFHGLLDAELADRGRAWRELIRVFGLDELFQEHFTEYTAAAVTEFMLWHPGNPDAVTACVSRARENARGAREQISSEMWEHLNRLHLLVSRLRPEAVLASPHDFFVRVREGSHSFQGSRRRRSRAARPTSSSSSARTSSGPTRPRACSRPRCPP